jgi:hypothetical protein
MSNLWDSLDPETQNAIAKQGMVGSRQSNENMNRIKEQLRQNPNLVMKFAKDAGIDLDVDGTDMATADDSLDANVDAALQESGDPMVAGDVPKTENADLETRVRTLETALADKEPATPNVDRMTEADPRSAQQMTRDDMSFRMDQNRRSSEGNPRARAFRQP